MQVYEASLLGNILLIGMAVAFTFAVVGAIVTAFTNRRR